MAMVILGIDPGLKRIGYGLVEKNGRSLFLLKAGILKITKKNEGAILYEVRRRLVSLIKKFRPTLLAVEKLYFVRNQKTGLAVAEVRGVIVMTAAEYSLDIKEYTPTEIKSGITGYGLADKQAVAKMVRTELREPTLRVIDDASDALAAAILAAQARG